MNPAGRGFTCLVCGYPGLHDRPVDGRSYSFEICPCCGFQYGYTDEDLGFTYEAWRAEWVAEGCPWRDVYPEPEAWDPREQLRRLTG